MSSSSRQPGHPSRRTNQSVSSTTSAASSRSDRMSERTSSRQAPSPAVETAVTRLLVSIKQLLEALTRWSKQEVTETDVSDVYVRLGNDFNAAVAAFGAYRIEMTELSSVPDNLRAILETCLSEDASEDVLSQYLPEVRKIITNLLQGLRAKQSIYRRIVSDHKHRSSDTANGSDRESRSDRPSSRREGTSLRAPSTRGGAEPSENLSRRSATSTRRGTSTVASPPLPNNGDVFVGGFAPPHMVEAEVPPPQYRSSTPGAPPRSQLMDTDSYLPARARSASAMDTSGTMHAPPNMTNGQQGAVNGQGAVSARGAVNGQQPNGSQDLETTPTPRPPSQVPGHVKRYSLVDRPVSSPTPPPMVVVDEAHDEAQAETRPATPQSPPQESVVIEPSPAPAVQNSLAALKQSETLERRASKRFSTYTFSKMTGGSLRGHGPGSNPNRRSLAVGGQLTAGDLATLTEADEEAPPTGKRDRSRPSQRPRNPSPIAEEPPVPPLPSSSRGPSPQLPPSVDKPLPEPAPSVEEGAGESVDAAQTSFPVFLQVGREVKKVVVEPPMTFPSLRVLFMDKFAYNPGKENFPAIYIRDPSSGVQYELEDADEIKEKCLLSLNIEPLDQIKQHIDIQISSLAQDIKDLRAAVASNRRASHPPPLPMIITQPLAESTPATARPTERQFHNIARRLSRLIPEEGLPLAHQQTGSIIQPQMTGASATSEYSTRVVEDLKTQYDEVQNLRRDLGIMRQLYTEFMKSTKESLGMLRTQTQNVRQLATTNVAGTRAFINDGKTKLDTRSQNVLTRVEELQDTVEGIKDDVLKRNISPKPQVLQKVRASIDAVAEELRSLKEHIQTVKPMWKKTWEEELQNIVEEQQFLQHQEEFLGDLLEDHKAAQEVYGHVEKVISLRGNVSARASRSRGFKPPPMDEGHTGLSTVMLEIRGAAVDQERRLKAIAANEKSREKELKGRSDEFQSELSGFVVGKKLKMTGGAEEVERVRQKRNEQTLKAMFTGPSTNSASNSIVSSPTAEAGGQ